MEKSRKRPGGMFTGGPHTLHGCRRPTEKEEEGSGDSLLRDQAGLQGEKQEVREQRAHLRHPMGRQGQKRGAGCEKVRAQTGLCLQGNREVGTPFPEIAMASG